jgi:outer membrane receptor protein involved in Fe transport
MPADAAALAVTGAIVASAAVAPVKQKPAMATDVPVAQRLVRAVSARELAREVVQRGRRRLRRRLSGRQRPGEAGRGAASGH